MTVHSVLRRVKDFREIARAEEGQALVEYALLISLVAVVCFVAVQAFGFGVSGLYSKINAQMP